jgi:hypothetical protein
MPSNTYILDRFKFFKNKDGQIQDVRSRSNHMAC